MTKNVIKYSPYNYLMSYSYVLLMVYINMNQNRQSGKQPDLAMLQPVRGIDTKDG